MSTIFPQVLQTIPGKDYTVFAYMNDGTIRVVDAKPLIAKGGVFSPLQDPDVFSKALTVMNDTVAWDLTGKRDPSDCIDLDPFMVQSQPITVEANWN